MATDRAISFWEQRICEHALMINARCEIPLLQERALTLFRQMKEAIERKENFTPYLLALEGLQENLLELMSEEKNVGPLPADLLNHMLHEQEYYKALSNREVKAAGELSFWISESVEHTIFLHDMVPENLKELREKILHSLRLLKLLVKQKQTPKALAQGFLRWLKTSYVETKFIIHQLDHGVYQLPLTPQEIEHEVKETSEASERIHELLKADAFDQ
jgi:hypothetical protein